MTLRLNTSEVIENAVAIISKEDIKLPCRLFYELGTYTVYNRQLGWSNWGRTGVFKEIRDVKHFIDNDRKLIDLEYIDHHNFHIWKE